MSPASAVIDTALAAGRRAPELAATVVNTEKSLVINVAPTCVVPAALKASAGTPAVVACAWAAGTPEPMSFAMVVNLFS
jgi:hypothetical protein